MRFSRLQEVEKSQSVVTNFLGYEHTLSTQEGAFHDMKNMTAEYYPVMSPRGKRGEILFNRHNQGFKHWGGFDTMTIINNHLYTLSGRSLYIEDLDDPQNHDAPDVDLSSVISTSTGLAIEHQLITMGSYVILMPEGWYINDSKRTDRGMINASFTNVSYNNGSDVPYISEFWLQLCDENGDTFSNPSFSTEPPASPTNGKLWVDTDSSDFCLSRYYASSSAWMPVTTYVKITCTSIERYLTYGDSVRLKTSIDSDLGELKFHTEELVTVKTGTNYIVVPGYIVNGNSLSYHSTDHQLSWSRHMPLMDYVFECGNRLWGCRKGSNRNGDIVNEIYASKLGDFKNWECYAGISTDSYAASVGSDGNWTGACAYNGYPTFFKEDYIHKVYGSYPASYNIQSLKCRGVMDGAWSSLAVVNETLFYKSRTGVCYYDGTSPVELSNPFGDDSFSFISGTKRFSVPDDPEVTRTIGAVAYGHEGKYYICMGSDKDKKFYLFVYDAKTGLWHKHDECILKDFCSYKGKFLALLMEYDPVNTRYVNKGITLINATDDMIAEPNFQYIEDKVNWMVETGIVGTSIASGTKRSPIPGKKYVSDLLIRMSLDIGSTASFFIQYDSTGEWEHVCTLTGITLKTYTVPIRPKRCDHFRVKVTGSGDMKIHSVTKKIERGSDY